MKSFCEKLLMSALFFFVIKTVVLTEDEIDVNKTESVIKPLYNRSFHERLGAGSTVRDLKSKLALNSSGKILNVIKCPKILRNKSCHGHARRWIRFYLKIGGWIMLSVITVGLFILISTHILSKRSTSKHHRAHRQRASIVEAMTKKKIINV